MVQKNKITIRNDTESAKQDNDIARCIIDHTGQILHANEQLCEEFGITPDQAYNITEVFTFEEDYTLEALESGEHEIYVKDKAIIESFQFDWITTPENEKYLIASRSLDDGEQKKSEDYKTLLSALKKKEKTSVFTDISHDLMMKSNLDGKILYANKTFKRILGFSSKEIQDLNISDLSISLEISTQETQTKTKNGDIHWIQWEHIKQNGAHYFCGKDITGIIKQKQNLERRERQLSEAEAIGRMGHWHWLIGEEDISWSEEIYRVFGLDKDAFKPTINALTPLIHKRDLGRVVQIFQRAMIEEKSYDMEFRIIQPGGDIRFVSCEGRCEKDANGEVIALYGIIQDMTERMLYEQNLKRAKDTSEQAYAAKSRFLANMSHELRTPLNAIIGFSEMIESEMLGPIFNEKYVEYASSIKESGQHLLDLISDILDMSKIEAGKHVLELEAINLKDVLQRAIHMIQGRAQEQNVTIQTDEIEECNLVLQADRRAMTQVFLNLLSNAVKFTPENGSIWIIAENSKENVTIKVCDSGVGIPPNKLAAVLKPFEQASNEYTRDYEGTGLGLSITKELIELHGGTMSIESKVGIGTSVSVRIPYEKKA